MLTSKQALRKIKVFYEDSIYGLNDNDNRFFADVDTDCYYSWRFKYKGKIVIITCDKETGEIVATETGKERL